MNLPQANKLVEQALNAYQNKKFAEAEEIWAVAGKLCADGQQWIGVASCRLNRGNALANLGRFAEAIAEFDHAEPIFDHFQSEIGAAGCRISRGDALARLGRFDEAISDSRVNRGMALQNLGRNKEAMANYEQARSIIFEICQWSDITRYQTEFCKLIVATHTILR